MLETNKNCMFVCCLYVGVYSRSICMLVRISTQLFLPLKIFVLSPTLTEVVLCFRF